MSVRIRGMRIPENCVSCPLALLNNYGERVCYVTEEDVTEMFYDRHDKCQIEEVDD